MIYPIWGERESESCAKVQKWLLYEKKKKKKKKKKRKRKKKRFSPLYHTPETSAELRRSMGFGTWRQLNPSVLILYGLHWDLVLAKASGERLAGPQTIPSASPLHHSTTHGIVKMIVSKRSSLFAALFSSGYCDVFSWNCGQSGKTCTWKLTQSQASWARLVPGWVT